MASKDSVIFSDGFKNYDGIVDYCYKHHFRVIYSKNEFAKGNNHLNGIENFWNYARSDYQNLEI